MSLEKLNHNPISKLNLLIEDLNKLIFNWELTDIIEVTYAYKNFTENVYFNKTLFLDFLWLDIDDIIIDNKGFISNEFLNKISFDVQVKLNDKINLIDTYLSKLNLLEDLNEQDSIRLDLLIWSLNYVKNILKITLFWVPFELEKAWLKHDLSETEVQDRVFNIEKLELENFWWKIKDNPEELILSYEYLRDKFEKNNKLLSLDEKKIYKEYLNLVEQDLPKDYSYHNRKKKVVFKNSILNKMISREKYIYIFKTVFDIIDLDFDVVEDERSSIYDGPNALHIPLLKEYDFLSIKRVIELVWHEIESHSVNLRNNYKLIWAFRWAKNLPKEEGLAIVVEQLLDGKKLDEITVPQHHSKVMIAEFITWNELIDFLTLDNKLNNTKWVDSRFLRLKRNYPLNYVWWQHKDTSYGRWVIEVVNYLKDWKDIRDLYLWKVSIEDIPKVKRLMDIKGLSYNDLNLPLFIWELVLFLYESEDNNQNSRRKIDRNKNSFMAYLKLKYPFIDFESIDINVEKFFVKSKVNDIIETFRTL